MKKDHLRYLACPRCHADLTIRDADRADGPCVESGVLDCGGCHAAFPIVRSVPRFVPSASYARSFSLEWLKHARTQYDSYSGAPISETRFFAETRWPRRLVGETILEVGSGSGRFTEQAASTGAMVVSIDYSDAVEANVAANGAKPNVLVVQADIHQLPVRPASCDRVVCIGVLQHTPDPELAFTCLPPTVKPGGSLVVDVYCKVPGPRGCLMVKYWVRPVTRRIAPEALYRWCQRYVTWMWPVTGAVGRVPYVGKRLVLLGLLVADYRGIFPLPEEVLKEWAVLDTFDALSPAYDQPQTPETVARWFRQAGFAEDEFAVGPGYNGIEGRGIRPPATPGSAD